MAAISNAVASGFQASSSRPAPRRIDWSGLWFRIVESEGEFVGMRGGRKAQDGHIDWVFPSHAEYDGLGVSCTCCARRFPAVTSRFPFARAARRR